MEKSAAIKAKLSVLSDHRRRRVRHRSRALRQGRVPRGRRHVRRRWSMIELAGKSAKVGKSVNVTDRSSAPVDGGDASPETGSRLGSSWTPRQWTAARPATVAAEFSVTTTAAPRRNRTRQPPPRTGMVRATQRVGTASDDGYFELSSYPTISAGVGARSDFAVKVFTADAGSGNAPALATALVVARVTGTSCRLT